MFGTERERAIYDYGYREGYSDSKYFTVKRVGEILAAQVEEIDKLNEKDKRRVAREPIIASARALLMSLDENLSKEDFEHLFGGAFWIEG